MKIVAILSMLHEPANKPDSATRRFRGEAPLAWTMYRLGQSQKIAETIVLCWHDQQEAVNPIVAEMAEIKARVSAPAARMSLPHLDSVAAARRWEEGWRGGLLQACEFDRGFHGPYVQAILNDTEADAVVLVDPSAGLVDPDLIDALISHAEKHEEVDLCFTPAAPGLSGVLLRKALINQLAAGGSHPGTLLAYRPDLPMRDPISTLACAARSDDRRPNLPPLHARFQPPDRPHHQRHRSLERATHLHRSRAARAVPRSLIRILGPPARVGHGTNPAPATRPIFSPLAHTKIERNDLDPKIAQSIFEEFAATDDARITFAGIGDPLLHPQFAEIVESASKAGINSLSAETDLLDLTPEKIDRLADLPLDIISIHIPAILPQTYQAVMGIDGLKQVMENLMRLVHRRQASQKGVPVIVPIFVKTAANLAEIEAWNDHWIRALGSAVITGPGDFAGQIPDASLVQMEPPKRRTCSRIARRLTILSDGKITACEQDFRGLHALGLAGDNSIESVWRQQMSSLRRDHAEGNWQKHALCAACKDWHRP